MRQRGVGEPEYRRQRNTAVETRQSAENHKQMIRVLSTLSASVDSVAAEHSASRRQADCHEKGKRIREWLTFGALMAAVAAALFTLRVTHSDTLDALEKTEASINESKDLTRATVALAETAQRQFQASERPWINVTGTANGPFIVTDTHPHLEVQLQIVNYGPSPALDVRYYAEIFLRESPEQSIEREKEICPQVSTRLVKHGSGIQVQISGGWVIFPHVSPTPDAIIYMSEQDAIKWKQVGPSNSIMPTMVGCADYQFTFSSAHHQTGFIYELYRSVAGGVIPIDPQQGDIPRDQVFIGAVPFLTPDIN
jgi:hypothetical protein